MTHLKPSHTGHIMSSGGSLEKTNVLGKIEGSRNRGSPTLTWLESIKVDIGLSLQELNWAVDRPRWTSPIHRVARSQQS